MTNEHRSSEPTHSDIRLVDAAVILVRHWVAFFLGLSLVLIFGVFYAVTADDKYEFVSLYQIAEESSEKWLEPPASLVARVENRILPRYESSFKRDEGRLMPFGITVSSPEGAGVLSLVTIAEERKSELIEDAHRHVISTLEEEQDRVLSDTRSRLKSQIAEVDSALEEVSEIDPAASYVSEIYRSRAQSIAKLNEMESGEVVSVAQQSVRPIGPNRKLIIAGSITGGLFFGIVLAFLSDFLGRVRSALRE